MARALSDQSLSDQFLSKQPLSEQSLYRTDITTPTEQPAKILVVDDLLENLRLLSNLLLEQGYDVRKAPDGAMALSNVPRFQPDLILLDIMMPDMDGYTVCEQLKSNVDTRDIPVVFLSAIDLTFDKIRAFEVGAADYINKPFHPTEVLARVKNQLRIRQQFLQIEAQQAIIRAQQQQLEEAIQKHRAAEKEYKRLTANAI
ncbi:MAG: response regulator [Cyanobacteria bacterium J06631_9]